MADLKKIFIDVGCDCPDTLLQSGNVAFRSIVQDDRELEALLHAEFERQAGFLSVFHVRSADELREIIVKNPLSREAESDPSHLLVHFLRHSPDPSQVQAVQSAVKGPELLRVFGRHLYIAYPAGIGDSTAARTPGWNKLMADGTARNWNTVLKLLRLCDA